MPGWPENPNCDMSTVSGMVFTSRPALLYTVTECRYIMFCAKTRPVLEASTDLGEMGPPIVSMSVRRRSSDGGPAGTRWEGGTVVVVVVVVVRCEAVVAAGMVGPAVCVVKAPEA